MECEQKEYSSQNKKAELKVFFFFFFFNKSKIIVLLKEMEW